MISTDIFKKIRKLQIKTNHLVTDIVSGSYESAFKGQGINFQEVREYQYGDDIRSIDWNVTARMDKPFIKLFREERELTIMLLIDVSASGQFGSHEKTKRELSAEIAAILSCTAIKNNDKVGAILFSDKIEKYIPPKKGNAHIWRVIKEVISYKPENIKTDLANALEYLMSVQRRSAIVFVISDFWCHDYEKVLRVANKKHDLISAYINDPREYEFPKVGLIELSDAETGERLLIDTNDKFFRENYKKNAFNQKKKTEKIFKKAGVDLIDIWTDRSSLDPIIKFFMLRGKRL